MSATTPRITARVDLDTQELLVQATALSGMSSINSFVLGAAVEKAKSIMEQERVLRLSRRDSETLVAALDRPAHCRDELAKAARRYARKSQK